MTCKVHLSAPHTALDIEGDLSEEQTTPNGLLYIELKSETRMQQCLDGILLLPTLCLLQLHVAATEMLQARGHTIRCSPT